MIKNDFVEYYGANQLSPLNQDLSDIELLYRRRQKLYRQCGIPTFAFKGANVLEVGPGSGYNILAPLHWGVEHTDLVEPNKKGIEDMKKLFDKQGIDDSRYSIFNVMLEEFNTKKKYDVVIAESFLQHLYDCEECCGILKDLVDVGGVVVITCTDEVSLFIESMKRLIGQRMAAHIDRLEDKVSYLVPIFEPQLKRLRGVSRYTKDWIEDQIFNPTLSNGCTFSMGDAVREFEGFDMLGSSPGMFTDYSWYKDVWNKHDYLSQFEAKRMSLILAGMSEWTVDTGISQELVEMFRRIRDVRDVAEKEQSEEAMSELASFLESKKGFIQDNMPESVTSIYIEITNLLLQVIDNRVPNMEDYPNFFSAFGRSQQYMSFMKV